MKRYAKFGYAAPLRFRVILEKPQGGGGGGKMTPPTRAKVKLLVGTYLLFRSSLSTCAALFSLYK